MTASFHEIPDLDRNGLRRFGIMTGGIVTLLFGLFVPWIIGNQYPVWPWIVWSLLAVPAIAFPASLRPIYHGWMRFGIVMSWVTTPIILGLVFYICVTPFSLVRKVFGLDSMARRIDGQLSTYRVESRSVSREDLEKPF